MLNRLQWQSYFRPDHESQWQWAGAGFSYGEAHSAALFRFDGKGEIICVFGRQTAEEFERRFLKGWR